MNILQNITKLFQQKNISPDGGRFFEKDGKTFEVRPLSEKDREEIILGFESISEETRYKRFLSYKKSLTDSEIEFFTHPDFKNHFAYGIQEIKDGVKTPFGIARFVRDHVDPTQAEIAIALRDDYQGQGFGTELLGFAVDEARKNNFRILYGLTLPDNEAILKLMKKFGKVEKVAEDSMRKISLYL